MKSIIFLVITLALMVAPWLCNDYVISILILSLYFAYVGQAWNLMMGYAGQLSLGHALYVGLGAYLGAGLFVHFNLSPWITAFIAFGVTAGIGAFIAWLGFRFAIKGVHFTLLTIAFAECARLIFEHWSYFGATAGLFLPVKGGQAIDIIHLRGKPILFYYVFLLMVGALFLVIRRLLQTRLGYFMLALREDQEAAASLGIPLLKVKIIAVALSGGLSSLGGLVYAFYQNSLFPEQTFSMASSIEFLMGPIVGGVGTLLGPIIGAFLLTPLGEGLAYTMDAMDFHVPGLKHLFYGSAMLAIMLFIPKGLWPTLKSRLSGVQNVV
ncbi:MAG: branched-chain amino acid ABC transporter permease [Alphaproteobacteria bacterium]|nr:branched-chain amino acid ABC transporter permease [Alphaproteobacteria bacterium]